MGQQGVLPTARHVQQQRPATESRGGGQMQAGWQAPPRAPGTAPCRPSDGGAGPVGVLRDIDTFPAQEAAAAGRAGAGSEGRAQPSGRPPTAVSGPARARQAARASGPSRQHRPGPGGGAKHPSGAGLYAGGAREDTLPYWDDDVEEEGEGGADRLAAAMRHAALGGWPLCCWGDWCCVSGRHLGHEYSRPDLCMQTGTRLVMMLSSVMTATRRVCPTCECRSAGLPKCTMPGCMPGCMSINTQSARFNHSHCLCLPSGDACSVSEGEVVDSDDASRSYQSELRKLVRQEGTGRIPT
jgi:hypothetical protein